MNPDDPQPDIAAALAKIRAGQQQVQHPKGQIAPGNIDLTNRPRVRNPDGSVSTVRSMSFEDNGHEVLVPTVMDDGRIVSNDEAIANYRKTGKHLGVFADPASATAYAQQLHQQQAAGLNQPTDDIGVALAKLRAQKPAGHDYHAEFASGALDKRMQGANARDAATLAEDPTEHDPGIAGSIADAAQGIPGVGALEAGARSVVRGQPYAEAYRDIKGATDKVPLSAKLIGRGAAASPLMALIPGSAATSGAIIGGADQALSADPNIALGGWGGRAARTAYGAAGGAALGKGLEVAETGVRAGLATNAAKNVFGRMADRADQAAQMFPAALREGAGKPVPPQVSAFLQEPEVASVVQRLQQTTHQGMPAESPEMLDAVNKVFSDQTKQAKKGLLAIDPSKPNTGRFTLQRLAQLKNQLYDAVSTPGPSGAMMPSYPAANQQYAKATQNLESFKTGYAGLDNATRGSIPSAKQLTKATPEAFEDRVASMDPEGKAAAVEGVLGRAKMGLSQNILAGGPRKNPLTGLGTVGHTPDLLRTLQDATQAKQDQINRLLLLIGGNAAPQ